MVDAEYEELDGFDGELDLADTDNLPWLESDAEDEDAGGLDMGQILGFAGVLLLLLAVVVGAVWYVSNRTANVEAVADGSIIEAPAGPIKQRPEDPGGKQFAGTGNIAPLVGEGASTEAVVGEPPPPRRPTCRALACSSPPIPRAPGPNRAGPISPAAPRR